MVVAATGFFDGVHIGHQAVIKTLLETAARQDRQSLVITFWPHPRVFLQNDARDLRLLTSVDEKVAMLKGMCVDEVKVLPFTREFASLSAKEYLQMMGDTCSVDSIVLGYDNRFGSDFLGTEQISTLAQAMGFDAQVVRCAEVSGFTVSSTRIRKELACGNVALASRMLGRDYSILGVVVGGKQMGRTIGFPTANLSLREPLKCVPGVGVYLSRVFLGPRTLWGMSNVDRQGRVETHIFDFDEDIYGFDIEVTFVDRIRDEIVFSNFEELKNQLKIDEISAKRLIFAEQ